MPIEKFKILSENDIFQGPHVTYSAVTTAYGQPGVDSTEGLVWYYVPRTGTSFNTNALKNLFHSFGVAREDDETWLKAFNVFDQIRAGDMLVAVIPQSACSTYIQGSTLELNVPTFTGTGNYTKFYGSSIGGYVDAATKYVVSNDYDPDTKTNGCSAVWLYKDSPYTGTVHGGRANPNSGLTTFSAANTTSDSTIPHLRATSISRGDTGYDIPEGVALLERGIFCIFDNQNAGTSFVTDTITHTGLWDASGATFRAITKTGGTWVANTNPNNRSQIAWTGSTAAVNAKLQYRPVNVSYKTIYFCHGDQNEFNSTSNHTYNHRKAFFRPMEADSVYITEIGLYNENDDLIAYGKLSEPVEKNKLQTLTIKVELVLQ